MGTSQADKIDSRERILEAASRQIRHSGLESVSIAKLMEAANLTHGGFYGHFPSRAALIEAALARALDRGEAAFVAANPRDELTVNSIIDRYLSATHRDNTAEGCAIASLSGDVGRADSEQAHACMSEHLERSFDRMATAMGSDTGTDDAAITAWCIMAGALTLSRVFRGTPRSDQILDTARAAILELDPRSRATS